MDIKNYLKDKWVIVKAVLILTAKVLLKNTWSKIKDMCHEIKTKVLVKELSWMENIADWLLIKADVLMEKLYGKVEDLLDAEGDSIEEELDVVKTPEDEGIPE